MKQIEKVSIWDNGITQNAEILNAYAVNVTLGTSATFYYALLSADKMQLAQGNLTMSGDDYQAWNDDLVAWEWIAEQLNLTIIGDWVEPVVETKLTTDMNVGGDVTNPSAKLEVNPVIEESTEAPTE